MNANKFLLVKGISGLGDRMLAALTGILYARLSGRRLLVDWRDQAYSGDGSNVFPRFFQSVLCSPTDDIPATDSVSPAIWRGHLRESAWDMREQYGNIYDSGTWQKFSIDFTKVDYQEDVLVMWTHNEKVDLLRRHFQGEFHKLAQVSTKAILRQLLHEDLLLHPEIWKRIEQFKLKNFSGKTVGVHVRYSDYRTRLWALLKALNTLLRYEPGLQIFLATDNRQIKKMFEESYAGVLTTPHWYPTPGLTIHYNRGQPDPLASGMEALLDLYLLAECDYLIIDTSSNFSYIAHLLTKAPDSNVFDVRQRGKPSPLLRRLTTYLMFKMGLFSWGFSLLRKFIRLHRHFSATNP